MKEPCYVKQKNNCSALIIQMLFVSLQPEKCIYELM